MNKIKVSATAIFSSLIGMVISYYASVWLDKITYYLFVSLHDMAGLASYLFTYFIVYPLLAGLFSAIFFSRGIKYLRKVGFLETHVGASAFRMFFVTSILSFIIAYKFMWLDG